MSIHTRSIALLLVLLSVSPGANAASKLLELKWNDLAPLISGQSIQIDLGEGGIVKGEALVVREDALMMEVKRSSKPAIYSKGNTSIPRNRITAIKLERTRGSGGRITGTVLGILAGLAFGSGVALQTDSKGGGSALFVVIAAGLGVGGYYAGKAFDRKTTLIRIVP